MVAAVAAPVTFAAVLTMSTKLEMGANMMMTSIGSPADARTAVAAMVAVPGTPAVPNETKME